MTPHYHPSQPRLLEHAAGALTPGRDLVLAAHVAVCPACLAEVRSGEAVGGALLESLPPAPMADDALARTLARIERPAASETGSDEVRAAGTAWAAFDSPIMENAWRKRRWAAPGVWVSTVISGPGAMRTYLLRVGPGMSVPHHTHRGVEMVTVLTGAYEDRGDTFSPGDFSENDDAVEHRPTVTREAPCVCLICTDAPLTPLDWVGKLFQPLVKI